MFALFVVLKLVGVGRTDRQDTKRNADSMFVLFAVLELVGKDWREFVGVISAILWGCGLIALSFIGFLIRKRSTLQLVLSAPTVVFVFFYFL